MADGGRSILIDHSGNQRRFASAAKAQGYAGGFEDLQIFDTLSVVVADDAKQTKQFFKTADPSDKTLRSQDPQIVYGQDFGDQIVAIYGVALEVDQLKFAGATNKVLGLFSILADAFLDFKANGKRLFGLRGSELLTGKPGASASAEGTILFRNAINRSQPYYFAVPPVLTRNSNISPDLIMPASLSATDDFKVRLVLHTLVARKGAPTSAGIDIGVV